MDVKHVAAGMWCDAVPVLLHTEWPKTRQGLTAITSQSTNAAVAAWLQVGRPPTLEVSAALTILYARVVCLCEPAQ